MHIFTTLAVSKLMCDIKFNQPLKFSWIFDFQEQCQTVVRATMCLSISVFLFKTIYNKTIIKFGFCDIRFNQGLGKCY